MENNVKIILEAWKKAREHNDKEIKKICRRYKVEEKAVEYDEHFIIYRFKDSKVEFTVPYDENFGDYELTGDTLKFAQKFIDINETSYGIADNEIKEEGFEEWDDDVYSKVWRKDGKEYGVSHYAKKEEDIEILEVKDE